MTQPATWPTARDVQGWKCKNPECGEWRDFADTFEGESHSCAVEPYECEWCDGRGGYVGTVGPSGADGEECPECNGSGKVPAKGVFTEAFA